MIELIVSKDEAVTPRIEPDVIEIVNDQYEIWGYESKKLPQLSILNYSYLSIPKCLGLAGEADLEDSGILTLQNYPTLSLNGQGVFVAVIDTGINYMDECFWDEAGDSKVFAMWDQVEERKYTKEQLDKKLAPNNDEDGHGTFMASVICGSEDKENQFVGAAPEVKLLVVKLRAAYKELKDYYFIPDETIAFSEADVMLGVSWAEEIAEKENKPLVICLGLGCNNGSHNGDLPLPEYLNFIAKKRQRAVVVAAGNQANDAKHYRGIAKDLVEPQIVEVNISKNLNGVYFEIWSKSPDIFAITVQSPSGEILPKYIPVLEQTKKYQFVFENTKMTIDYRFAGKNDKNLLISVRLEKPVRGIWTVRVFPKNIVNGVFDVWLPMNNMLEGDVYFLMSSPDTTITMPSDAKVPITVGGYDPKVGSVYIDSGRGFDFDGDIKPDFLAPAVKVVGRGMLDNYVSYTGTSAAAAIVAGGCAQILEYAVVRGNEPTINSVDVKNFLIRGATRSQNENYPSPQKGYGIFNIYNAFLTIL